MTRHRSPEDPVGRLGTTMPDTVPSALRAQMLGRADRRGLVDVAFDFVDSPVGPLLLATSPLGLVKVAFVQEDHEAVLNRLATEISPRLVRLPARLDPTHRQLDDFFARRRREFDLPLDLRLAKGFRRTVLDSLRGVGYGTTISYTALAAASGNPRAVRAAATACATNPLPLVIPCHRIVRSDGSVGKYGGGSEAKEYLIALEKG